MVQEAADAVQEPGKLPELDRQERALIANVLRLRGTTADDVMVPRADIIAMPVDVTLDQALEHIRREGHSRMPVFREQLDDIVGMVHIKDVFAYAGKPDEFKLEAVVRVPLMVAPQMPVLDLLLQMRQARIHLALVVDEYGGIDGLVTIEDLVETITGDIADGARRGRQAAHHRTARRHAGPGRPLAGGSVRGPVRPGADLGRARGGHRHGRRPDLHPGRTGGRRGARW